MEDYRQKFLEKHSFPNEQISKYKDNDIRFDVDFDMPEDALEQWDEYKEKNGYISFVEWTGVDNKYAPRNIDRSGMEEFKKSMFNIFRQIESSLEKMTDEFYNETDVDDDSDLELEEDLYKNK